MRLKIRQNDYPFVATLLVCLLLYASASIAFYQKSFFSLPMFEMLFSSKAALGIMSVGMTFVILSGGIDLSVGSVMSLATMVVAMLVAMAHVPAWLAIVAGLAAGASVGLLNGVLIQIFELPPFLVTLATLFLARGIALVMNHTNRIALDTQAYPFFDAFTSCHLRIVGVYIYLRTIVLLAIVLAGIVIARTTGFGRTIYAIGGNEQASVLMGLPVARTKVLVYVMSGLLAALAGVVMLSDSPAGDPTIAVGWELDAIAAVVIGGTLLSGGVGSVGGTLLGVLIISLIELMIINYGADPSRARIINGLLLFAFIALQKLLPGMRRLRRKASGGQLLTG